LRRLTVLLHRWSSAGEEDAEYQRRKRNGATELPEYVDQCAVPPFDLHKILSARSSAAEPERWWLKAELDSQNESLRRQLHLNAVPVSGHDAAATGGEEEHRPFGLVTGMVVLEEPTGLRRLDKAISQHIRQTKNFMNKLRAGVRSSSSSSAAEPTLRRFDGAEPARHTPAHATASGAGCGSITRDEAMAYLRTATPGLANGAIVELSGSDTHRSGTAETQAHARELSDARALDGCDVLEPRTEELLDDRAWHAQPLTPAQSRHKGTIKTWDTFLGGPVDGHAPKLVEATVRSGGGARPDGVRSPVKASAPALDIGLLERADGTRSDGCASRNALHGLGLALCYD
jgi:hypothetical protein